MVALLANAGAAMNFSTIEIAVMLMGDAEGLTRGWEMSLLDSLVFAGCILGMLGFGYVGDLVGRVAGLRAACFVSIFGVVASSATPMDTEVEVAVVLCAARFVLGVGIGGVYPLAAALAYERGDGEDVGELSVAAANFGQPCGVLCLYASAFAIYETPGLDSGARWRSMLLVGAVPFALALVLADGLPRDRPPPAPDAAKDKGGARRDAFAARLEDDGPFRVALFGAASAWCAYNCYAYGIICFYPELTAAILGDDVAARAGKGCEIPNFKGSYLGRFPLVLADFWTRDHLSERSRP